MAQFARPSSDVTDGSWLTDAGSSVLYAAIDEASASDTDYIYSPDNTDTTCEIALSSVTDPTSSTGHIVRYRYARSDESASPIAAASGGSTSSVQVFLYQGATLIATGTSRNTFDGAWAADSFTLSGTEADNITDYTDLRVQIAATGGGGSPANRRGVGVSWAELEVPDAATAYTLTCDTTEFTDDITAFTILEYHRVVGAATDSYALTGTDIGFLQDIVIPVSSTLFGTTGQEATLRYGKSLVADAGSWANLGGTLNLLKNSVVGATTDSYILTGTASNLLYGRAIDGDNGSVSVTGSTVDFLYDRMFSSEGGSIALTGTAASLLIDYLVGAGSDSFTLTGTAATLTYNTGYTLVLDAGSISVSGSNVTLTYSAGTTIFNVNPASFTLSASITSILGSIVGDSGQIDVIFDGESDILILLDGNSDQEEAILDGNSDKLSVTLSGDSEQVPSTVTGSSTQGNYSSIF